MILRSKHEIRAVLSWLLVAITFTGCGKPSPQVPQQPDSSHSNHQPSPPAVQQREGNEKLSTVAVHILNAAHRSGGIILSGECTGQGIAEKYAIAHPAHADQMEQSFQDISAKYQNIYWRQSPATGVRVMDSTVKAKLLNLRIREFRVLEDLEPDGVMAVLWREPAVKSFLRRNHATFVRRAYGAKKAISPPMILEIKNRTVADILDHIAAAYHRDPPKVWVYQECTEKGTTLIDVRIP
jgi:hypothetical protein